MQMFASFLNTEISSIDLIGKCEEYANKMELYWEWIVSQEDQMIVCLYKLMEELVIYRRRFKKRKWYYHDKGLPN